MSGALWALIAGIGFGIFQAMNGRAVREVSSIYTSTFLQLLLATAALGLVALIAEDPAALGDAPAWSLIAFALAGVVHFFLGWTTLNLSQVRIGAARTGPLLSTTPLFGLLLAALLATQFPAPIAIAGIGLTIAGAIVVQDPSAARGVALRDSGFALATAFAWAISALLILEGLEGLGSPLLGVTLGMSAACAAYGGLLLLLPPSHRGVGGALDALAWKLAAGLIVGLATWARWVAIEDTEVAVVLALNLASVPMVLWLAPVFSGRHVEVVTARVWAGAGLIMAGALILIGAG